MNENTWSLTDKKYGASKLWEDENSSQKLVNKWVYARKIADILDLDWGNVIVDLTRKNDKCGGSEQTLA